MAATDYDFELVVSRKLLLSILCLIVVLFGLVYFFGYSAGYDRARTDQESAVAAVQPIEQSGDSVQLPDALLTDAPEVSPRPAADSGARGAAV